MAASIIVMSAVLMVAESRGQDSMTVSSCVSSCCQSTPSADEQSRSFLQPGLQPGISVCCKPLPAKAVAENAFPSTEPKDGHDDNIAVSDVVLTVLSARTFRPSPLPPAAS